MNIKSLHVFRMLAVACLTFFLTPAQAQLTYCAATNAGGGGSMINNVVFGSINNNTASSNPTASPFYTLFTTPTTTVIAGTNENLTVTIDAASTYSGAIVSVWIDFNQDGTLAASEWTQVGTNIVASTSQTVSVAIPATATLGTTRMRIRSRGTGNANGSTDACTGMGSGETEDYNITIAAATACAGVPNAGSAATSPAAVCPNVSAGLSLTGATVASGLTYQWQSSPAGLNTWTSIAAATNPSYSTTISANTDFRAIITCTNGGGMDTSNPVLVSLNPFYNCYCTSTATSTADGEIFNVTVDTLNNSSVCSSSNQMYTNYAATLPAAGLGAGTVVPWSITAGSCGGSYPGAVKIYIDLNQDGDFTDVGEEVAYQGGFTYTPTGYIASGILQIPSNATLGTTRMRVMMVEGGTQANMTPCGTYGYGETEDYLVTIYTPPACSGTPNAGTAASSKTTTCPNAPFSLSLTGFSSSFSGITVQWESSPAGAGMWSPVTGATLANYTVTGGITSATDYRALVTCTNGGGFAYSNTVSVTMSPFFICYCGPATGINLNNFAINITTNVNIPTTSLNNNTSSTGSNGYMLFYPTTSSTTATLTQGVQYQLNITNNSTGYYTGAWIDYDGSGTFDTSEFINLAITGTSGTAIFNVPTNAAVGQTGMRLRTYWQNFTKTQACFTNFDYETEDYVITIAQAVPCSGTPNGGVAYGPSTVCSGAPFLLQDTTFTVGGGVTYQWESSPSGAGMWSPVTGATNPLYNVAAGITSATDFRLLVTCTNGGGFSYSNTVSVGLSPFYICYCGPATGINLNQGFTFNVLMSVAIPLTTLNNTTTTVPPSGYSLFYPTTASTTASLTQGVQYTLNVTHNGTGYYTGAWIDYDGSGTFDTSEFINLVTTGSAATATFMVPSTATVGQTGLRLRTNWMSFSQTQPCTAFLDYETEDYVIDILQSTACTGTPSGGTAYASASVCANAPLTLQDSTFTVGAGITYQWESSPAGMGTWTAITGATNPLYTLSSGITAATDFRLVVTCTNTGGGTGYSNTISVTMNSFYNCYCTSTATTPYDGEIYNVTFGTLNNTSNCTNGNQMYTSYTSLTPPTVTQGASVPISVTAGSCGGSYPGAVKVWIDYNQDGVYDNTTEVAFFQGGFNYTVAGFLTSGNVSIPPTAMTGTTGMRVVMEEGGTSSMTPCTSYGYGETEDYLVTIAAATPCTGTPNAGTAYGPASACAGVSFTLVDTAFSIGSGITYQWQSSPAGTNTWTNMTGATSPSYTVVGGIMSATDYRMVITCTNTSSTATSNVVSLSTMINAPWTYDVEAQPVNTSVQMADCWVASPTPGFVYSWHVASLSTPSSNTGPDLANSGSKYFFTEASYGIQNDIADLTTPQINVSMLTTPILEFFYHFYGSDINKMYVSASSNGTTWTVLDSIVGQQHTSGTAPWTKRTVSLAGYTSTVQIRFSGIRGVSFAGDLAIDDIAVINAPACSAPGGLAINSVAANTANVSWNAVTGATGYQYAITTSATPPASGTTTTSTTVSNASYTPGSMTYYLHVRTACSGSATSAWTTLSFVANNNASGAMMLGVNAGCTSNPYNNSAATQSVSEPYPSCNNNSTGHHTVWFKFVAPPSGAVKVSTDILPAGTFIDTKVGLFSATDSSNYSTFQIISCDEDGGVNINYNSNVYAVGLTPGTTYYIQVDGWGTSDFGTFCLTVDSLVSSMIASAATTCATSFQTPEGSNTAYTGWQPLITNSNGGQLVAMVRNQAGGAVVNYSGGYTVHTSTVRNHNGQYYLNRNYMINNTSATNVDVRFFFLNSELTALQGVDPAATPGNLNVTRQTGSTCQSNFSATGGTNTALAQTANGIAGGVRWVQVNTPGFSNFYLMSGAFPLAIDLKDIKATNVGAKNRVDWTTASEAKGDKFELERSADGRNFTQIATIQAKGEASTYSYWDQTPVTGVNYYRLKMVDAAGTSNYSQVVTATVKSGSFLVEAFPNPVQDVLTVKAYGTTDKNATVTISDATGKVVKVISMENGVAVVDMKGMAQGMYLVKYADNTHSQLIKVNKQ